VPWLFVRVHHHELLRLQWDITVLVPGNNGGTIDTGILPHKYRGAGTFNTLSHILRFFLY
jgi:hypothetical protein